MKGVFINCSSYPFIEAILRRDKTGETRTKDVLRSMFDPDKEVEYVALIETGTGKARVRGYAMFERGMHYSDTSIRVMDHILKLAHTKYESDGSSKYVYWIYCPERCDEYDLPSNAIRHGYSWCEWED